LGTKIRTEPPYRNVEKGRNEGKTWGGNFSGNQKTMPLNAGGGKAQEEKLSTQLRTAKESMGFNQIRKYRKVLCSWNIIRSVLEKK